LIKRMKKDVKAEFHVSIGDDDVTSEKVVVEIIDEEDGNKFLALSLKDVDRPFKEATIITSTSDLKRILEVAEEHEGEGLNKFFIGTKEGTCPLCNERKTLLLLNGGIACCKPCLDTLASILKSASKPTSKEDLFRNLRGHREKWSD